MAVKFGSNSILVLRRGLVQGPAARPHADPDLFVAAVLRRMDHKVLATRESTATGRGSRKSWLQLQEPPRLGEPRR